MDPLSEYYEALRDAPVPARLMAETPPEALRRKLATNLVWAAAGATLALAVSAMPVRTDATAAARTAQALAMRGPGR